MFGDQGASWSVIYVDIDAHNRNRTIFETILPRESNSKVCFKSFIYMYKLCPGVLHHIGKQSGKKYAIQVYLKPVDLSGLPSWF